MDLIFNNQKISTFSITPTTTVKIIKDTLNNWLIPQGIVNYSIRMILNNGVEISPVVFNTNTYDNIDFKSQYHMVNGGKIMILTKDQENQENQDNKKSGFTGNKNLDTIILNNLSDEDLHNACLTNKYISNICMNDLFWATRLQKKYPYIQKYQPYDSWKSLYIYHMIKERYGRWLGTVEEISHLKPSNVTPGEYYKWLNNFDKYVSKVHEFDKRLRDRIILESFKSLINFPSLYLMFKYYNFPWYERAMVTELKSYNLYIGEPTREKRKANLVKLENAEEIWKDHPDYVFSPTLRVFGNPDVIMKYFNGLGYNAQNDIDKAITINNYNKEQKGVYDSEIMTPSKLLSFSTPQMLPDMYLK